MCKCVLYCCHPIPINKYMDINITTDKTLLLTLYYNKVRPLIDTKLCTKYCAFSYTLAMPIKIFPLSV